MKKLKLILAMYKALSTNRFFVIAKMSNQMNEPQIEIHPVANLKDRMNFYANRYTENLTCKNGNTKIVAYADGTDMIEAVQNISEKIQGEEC